MTSSSVPPTAHPGPLDLGGRTALVTGAASGIGRACVLGLAAAGAKVRAVDRDTAGQAEPAQQADRAGDLPGAVAPQVVDPPTSTPPAPMRMCPPNTVWRACRRRPLWKGRPMG